MSILEDYDHDANPPVTDDPIGVNEAHQQTDTDVGLIVELTTSAIAIEHLITCIKTNGIVDKNASLYIHYAVKSNLSHLGLEHLYKHPSLESIDSVSQEQIIVSLENIVGKLWNSVSNMTSKMVKSVTDFFQDFYQDIHAVTKKAEVKLDEIKLLEDKPYRDKTHITQAHILHLSGKTDKASIIKGFENLCKVNHESYPKYIDNVKQFYATYFRAYQEIIGKKDWLEDKATQGKLIDNFIATVKKDMDVLLDTDEGRLELSGGKVFKSRNIIIDGLPDLVAKNPSIDVEPNQEIATPTKEELIHILELIISNAKVLDSYWARTKAMLAELSKARADAADDSINIDRSRFLKLVSRVGSHADFLVAHGSIMQPLNVLAWHTLHVSRTLLKVVGLSQSGFRKHSGEKE